MLEYREKAVQEVASCICDRCGRRMLADDLEFHERVSITYRGGFGSIFGDGCEIGTDLCQHCVRDTLGTWLRIAPPDLGPVNESRPLSALKGIVRHDGDAKSIETMNSAIAASAIGSEPVSSRFDGGDRTRQVPNESKPNGE